MSKRRQPGEIVVRIPGSGFLGSADPAVIQVPEMPNYDEETMFCMLCDDKQCREWANLKIIGGEHDGKFLFHISECQMKDLA
jgi:hypothetical protein